MLMFSVWENILYSLFEKHLSKSGLLGKKSSGINRKTLSAF